MNKTIIQFQASRDAVPSGTRLNDIYEIEEQIAAGGMGEIYRGRLIETGDPVAIKMIKPELANNEAVLALFRKEASALHHLHHDSIVRYYVFTIDRTINRPYLAMEFVEGRQLQDILHHRKLSFDEVNVLRKRIAAGLQAAHDKGIIHRDISPDNIILPNEDVRQAKIIDFGIARSTKLGAATVIGDGFAGKYNYVSPEQLGMFGGEVTGRSDIYSLGLVLVESLLGKALDMSGSQAEVVLKRQAVPDLTGVDARLRPLIERMLQPKPEDRPADMNAVVEWSVGTAARPGTAYNPGAEPAAGGSKTPMIAGGLAAALAIAGGVGWFAMKPAPAPVTPPGNAQPQQSASGLAPPGGTTGVTASRGPLDARERAIRIAEYVRYYDGGACFFALPQEVSDKDARVDVLTPNDGAAQLFNADFRNVNGFDAKIVSIPVAPAQCDFVTFLQRVDAGQEDTFSMQVETKSIKPGGRVQATLVGTGEWHTGMFALGEDGVLRNLTAQTKRDQDIVRFEGRIDEQDRSPVKQKLLIAVATPKPLAGANAASQPAATFFDNLAGEIGRSGGKVHVAVSEIRFE